MPTFAAPSTSSDSSSSQSNDSFRTAVELEELELTTMAGSNSDIGMEMEETAIRREYILIEQMNIMKQNYEQQINLIKEELSLIKAQTQQQNTQSFSQSPPATNNESVRKRKPLKWPESYAHEDTSKWPATHGVLLYIYERDVRQDGFLEPSDFFMRLFSRTVTGNAKDLITGQVEDMMKNQKTWDALGLLKSMDEVFRDRNADRTASTLLHACKQFRDERLSSFLPRFQKLLARSPSSSVEDVHKLHLIENAINQSTQNYLVGRSQPAMFKDLMEFLYTLGGQIEKAGVLKTRTYNDGETGIFDDGTRGIAGGKLLGRNQGSFTHQAPPVNNEKDADGDTKMTGINRIRAKWVTPKEIQRRKTEGLCIRCGNLGHRIAKCHFLPPERPGTAVSNASIDSNRENRSNEEINEIELKE